MLICKICNPQLEGNGYCAEHSTGGTAYMSPKIKPQQQNKEDKKELEKWLKKDTKTFLVDLYNISGVDGEKLYRLFEEIEWDLHTGSSQKKLLDFIAQQIQKARQEGHEMGKKEVVLRQEIAYQKGYDEARRQIKEEMIEKIEPLKETCYGHRMNYGIAEGENCNCGSKLKERGYEDAVNNIIQLLKNL